MSKEHWSKRLHDVLSTNEQPSYQLLEEAVAGLLEERQALTSTLTDMSTQVGHIIIARTTGNTDRTLGLVDALIEKHVVVASSAPATLQ